MTTSELADSDPDLPSLLDLTGQDSCYVVNLSIFERNLRRLTHEFRSRYPRTDLACSYKTNYLPALLRTAHQLGARTEVVSRMELDYAAILGTTGPSTLFNGPVKNATDMARVFDFGGTVILDSVSEIEDALSAAKLSRGSGPARIAIRCQLPMSTPNTRFGIDLRTPEASAGLRRIDMEPNVELVGLHVHHSGDRSVERYQLRIRELIDLHRDLLESRKLEFLDIGGGFGSPLPAELSAQLGGDNPTYSEYADAVTSPMISAYGLEGPTLIVEPGMGVLADTTLFLTRVMRTKTAPHRNIALVDGSLFNVKPLRSAINLPGYVLSSGTPAHNGNWRFMGHTCMEIDILRDDHVGAVAEGDLLVMPNLGAYTTVLNAPFISPLPPIVTWDGDAQTATIARPQLAADHLAQTFGAAR